jgi:Zn-dependent peptidase ImmA (M78 family)/DNA-binding XRE family transcriptional regulator
MNTPSPDRLRAARVRLGWSLDELAKRMAAAGGRRLSRQALSQFENGVARPSVSTLVILAKALTVRLGDLMAAPETEVSFVAFRKLASLPKREQQAIRAQVQWQVTRRTRLHEAASLPRRLWTIERFQVSEVGEAEDSARRVRDEWQLGRDAIHRLSNVLEQNGVEVFQIESTSGFSGISGWTGDGWPLVAVRKRDKDGARQRMDLAHELAHLVAEPGAGVDEEAFAKRFAGAFLLPRETVLRELGPRRAGFTLAELRALKVKYGVSMQAWVRRAADLGILSQAAYRQTMMFFGSRGMRTDEGDPYVAVEEFDRDLQLASRAVTEGMLLPDEAAALTDRKADDFERLQDGKRKVVSLRERLRGMSRDERRCEAAKSAAKSAEHYAQHGSELLPDFLDEEGK